MKQSTTESVPQGQDQNQTIEPANRRGSPVKVALFAAIAALVVAAIAALWFGFVWVSALFGDAAIAKSRDAAMDGARQAAINLNSFDVSDIDQSFENMRSSITGDQMQKDLDETEKNYADKLKEAQEDQISADRSTAEPLHTALTEFNRDDGRATALAVVAVSTYWPTQIERTRVTMRIVLEEVDGGVWKASSIEAIGAPTQLEMKPREVVPQPEVAPAPDGAEPAPEGGAPVPAPEGSQPQAPVPAPEGPQPQAPVPAPENPEGGQ